MSGIQDRDEAILDASEKAKEVISKTVSATVKEIEVDGYKFTVDTDTLDDVESLEIIERIENKGQVAAVIPLLKQILGVTQYEKMKSAFSELDAKAHAEKHPSDKEYKGRFRVEQLSKVYLAIIEKFDPKG